MSATQLILASASTYRGRLLKRLRIPFQQVAANIDETPFAEEPPLSLVKRLSAEKAKKVAESHPEAWIIGSDQIALFDGQIIGKPGSHENAVKQLERFSNNRVEFVTGVCIYQLASHRLLYEASKVQVDFNKLSSDLIENYLQADQPYDCAGSFKIESLGVCLFKKVVSEDPTALEGLPLISLCRMLREVDLTFP